VAALKLSMKLVATQAQAPYKNKDIKITFWIGTFLSVV